MPNMLVQKRSRKAPVPGDVFVMHIPVVGYLWGRVISTEARTPGPHGEELILIYVYSVITESFRQIPKLDKNSLLLPPAIINRLGWSRGYFLTVASIPLSGDDVFQVHCFESLSFGNFFDEFGRPLERQSKPCGIVGVGNHRTVDDDISRALGIRLSED